MKNVEALAKELAQKISAEWVKEKLEHPDRDFFHRLPLTGGKG